MRWCMIPTTRRLAPSLVRLCSMADLSSTTAVDGTGPTTVDGVGAANVTGIQGWVPELSHLAGFPHSSVDSIIRT
jgi:hypothetical protein